MDTIWSGWLWIFLSISIVTIAVYWFLNKLYYLDSWFKALCFLLISGGIIGAAIMLLGNGQPAFLANIQENLDEMSQVEEATQVEEQEPDHDNTAEIISASVIDDAHAVRQRIFKIINEDIKPKQESVMAKVEENKQQQKSDFQADSTLVTLETYEMLLGTRYDYIAEDIKSFQRGELMEDKLSANIQEFSADIDSITAIYGSN